VPLEVGLNKTIDYFRQELQKTKASKQAEL